MAFEVTVIHEGKIFTNEYTSPVLLTEVISESGFSFDAPCGSRGVCGNCRVIARGELSSVTDEEAKFFGENADFEQRLACMTYATGDCIIEIPSSGYGETEGKNYYTGEIKPITGEKECFACAVDIGTTMIAFKYYSLPEGKLVFCDRTANPQRIRGADVVTRISYALSGGAAELKLMLNNAMVMSERKFGKKVEFYVIAGNTTMLHLLSGMSTAGIAAAPFSPESLFGCWKGNRYYMRCTSAYIGSDVIASLLASGAVENGGTYALLDIGTNNECILCHNNRIYACSSPAGPAFEGANISCGMPARDGAICSIKSEDGVPIITTVSPGTEPTGFCGSGLIDAIAFLLENKYLGFDGSVIKELPYFGKAKLLGQDIAELQLAKSAVCAGLKTLCYTAGIVPNDIEKIYLTGSFGNKIDPVNAERIGLLPQNTASKTVSVGCGAVDGAAAILLNEDMINKSEMIAKATETVELADCDYFSKEFISNLYFEVGI